MAALVELLRRLDPDEVAPAVGFLTGAPRQGRIGVGWATLSALDVDRGAGGHAHHRRRRRRPHRAGGDVGRRVDGGARRRCSATCSARATEAEASFLYRLLVGELRQGALEGVMTDAVAKAAGGADRRGAPGRHVLAATSAGRRRWRWPTGEAGLDAIGLTPLHPVQPMLAATSATVAEALAATGPASVEWKLDGARIQVHRAGDEVRIFTRNLNDITDRLPAGGRRRCGPSPPTRSCSTARPSAWTTTAGPTCSRTR